MKPTVGRIVIAEGPKARSNGAEICPAIITRVWSTEPDGRGRWTVNATLFPDAGQPLVQTSLHLCADRAAALEVIAQNEHATPLYWPERSA